MFDFMRTVTDWKQGLQFLGLLLIGSAVLNTIKNSFSIVRKIEAGFDFSDMFSV